MSVAEADEGEDRVLRRPWQPRRALEADFRAGEIGSGEAGALSLSSSTSRAASFGPTPGARAIVALSCRAMAELSASAEMTPRMPSATLAPTPWTFCSRRNQSRSAVGEEAVKPDRVLAHMGLDQKLRRLAQPRGSARKVRAEAETR